MEQVTDSQRIVASFQLEDCGVDHCQYFTGRGTVFTAFDVVFVGIGSSASEACEDALEQAAMSGWNVDAIDNDLSNEDDVPVSEDDEYQDNDFLHYVAVYLA